MFGVALGVGPLVGGAAQDVSGDLLDLIASGLLAAPLPPPLSPRAYELSDTEQGFALPEFPPEEVGSLSVAGHELLPPVEDKDLSSTLGESVSFLGAGFSCGRVLNAGLRQVATLGPI